MAGIVERIENRFSIPQSDGIDGIYILPDLPEVGVIEPENGADEHPADHYVRDQNNCFAFMPGKHLAHNALDPVADILKPLSLREPGILRGFDPLLIKFAVQLHSLLCGKSLPLAVIDIDEPFHWLNGKPEPGGDGFGGHHGSLKRTSIDCHGTATGKLIGGCFSLPDAAIVQRQVSPAPESFILVPGGLPVTNKYYGYGYIVHLASIIAQATLPINRTAWLLLQDRDAERLEGFSHGGKRKPDHIRIIPFNPFDYHRSKSLDGISPRFSQRFA